MLKSTSINFLLFPLLIIIISSCNHAEVETATKRINLAGTNQKNWQLITNGIRVVRSVPGSSTVTPVVDDSFQECEQDDLWVFENNGNYRVEDFNNTCLDADENGLRAVGSYRFIDNEFKLVINSLPGSTKPDTATIIILTSEEMTLEFEIRDTSSNSSLIRSYNFVKF